MSTAEESSDDALVSAFIAGSSAAMETLFRRYRKPVFAWVLRMVGNRDEAEDIYQEVWLRVIRRACDYASGGFKAWMWRIARNCVIDGLRKKRPSLVLDAPLADDEGETTVIETVADETAICALEGMEAKERRVALRAAIAQLSPPIRQVVLLRINGELAFHEIAEMLGLPLGTVLGRMHLAVKRLKDQFVRKGLI